jgi:TPR repeat protein
MDEKPLAKATNWVCRSHYKKSVAPIPGGGRVAATVISAILGLGHPPAVLSQAIFDTMMHGGWLHEQESRFLPGSYYFTKGNDYFRRDDPSSALHCWEIAAGWAMKDAQYNLGIAYFKGLGVPADRPRGLAWLALAAERKDAQFTESLAAAWDQVGPTEHDQANAIWRELRMRYADAVALPAAERRFNNEMAQITGSRVGMPGHVKVWTSKGMIDVATYRKDMQEAADVAFGHLPRARVDVGPLQALDDAPSPQAR